MPSNLEPRFLDIYEIAKSISSGSLIYRVFSLATLLILGIAVFLPRACLAESTPVQETWESIDRRVKPRIFHLSVGLKIRLSDGRFVQYTDNSAKNRYAVFTTFAKDHGFRVVGFGTAFPIKTTLANQEATSYFVTNRHVVDSCLSVMQESQRFYAAMRLFAEQTAAGANESANARFEKLQSIVAMAREKEMGTAETVLYRQTVDAIWDCYETYLSRKADAGRLLFEKYSKLTPLTYEIGYFIHAPGPVTQPPLKGNIWKVARKANDPDLAILTVRLPSELKLEPLILEENPPAEGQEVQVVGYPAASDQIDVDAAHYYTPTFSTGRITRVAARMIQIDAPVTNGNSGGPVLNSRGKVIGIVALRAIDPEGRELRRFGSAFQISCLKEFAGELFKSSGTTASR